MTMITGAGIPLFRLLTIRSGLKLEMVGLKMSRGVSVLKLAKQVTGNKSNDRGFQIKLLDNLIEKQKEKLQPGDIS